jgi:hypothetical protein
MLKEMTDSQSGIFKRPNHLTAIRFILFLRQNPI